MRNSHAWRRYKLFVVLCSAAGISMIIGLCVFVLALTPPLETAFITPTATTLSTPHPTATPHPTLSSPAIIVSTQPPVVVVSVIDPITIQAVVDGEIRLIRYTGLIIPPDQTCREMALAAHSQIMQGQTIRLAGTGEDADGRLLRDVYLGEEWVAVRLLLAGYALADQSPGGEWADYFLGIQSVAESAGAGCWAK